tara:strand:+ start:724 stop:1248 length:525 start_codon:yes stop_codon:yes gene_type:complete
MNIFATLLVSIGLILFPSSVFSENDPSSKYRVLLIEDSGLGISTINNYLDQAKVSIKDGNVDDALEKLQNARTISNTLINYYRDLHSSFKGIDALIPRELAKKNRNAIQLLAKANMQLATIHRSKGDHELAVPLLVDVVKILSPENPRGAKAYQQLVELGFVDTPYSGSSSDSL